MANCEMCGEAVSGPMEAMRVDGETVKVGECCFWHMMED